MSCERTQIDIQPKILERKIYLKACVCLSFSQPSHLIKLIMLLKGALAIFCKSAITLLFLGPTPPKQSCPAYYLSLALWEWLIKFLRDPLEQAACPTQQLPPSIMQI